jgi:hypothetical protein
MSEIVIQEGYVWVKDTEWKKLDYPMRCRRMLGNPRKVCCKETLYALRRSNGYWAYCSDHMYGRRIRDGIVEIQAHPNTKAAKQGWI